MKILLHDPLLKNYQQTVTKTVVRTSNAHVFNCSLATFMTVAVNHSLARVCYYGRSDVMQFNHETASIKFTVTCIGFAR